MTEEQWTAYVEQLTAKFVTMVDWHMELVRQNNELIAENKKLRAELTSTRTGKLRPCEHCGTISNVFPRTCCNQGQFDDTSLASLAQEKGDE